MNLYKLRVVYLKVGSFLISVFGENTSIPLLLAQGPLRSLKKGYIAGLVSPLSILLIIKAIFNKNVVYPFGFLPETLILINISPKWLVALSI